MGLPTQMGRYIARPLDWTAEESEVGQRLLQFVCRFELAHHWSGSEWVDVSQDDLSITGYFYLMKSDGKPNTSTIENLKASLGWDGRSVGGLTNGEWGGVEVQITVGSEEYQGKTKIKVKWIAPRDADPRGGGIEKPAPQVIQSLDAKYGSMFRALGGGSPSARPTPPAAAGNSGATPATAQQAAWAAFKAKAGQLTQDERTAVWGEALEQFFGHRDRAKIADGDWQNFTVVVNKSWTPVGGIPQSMRKKQPEPAGGPPFGDEQQFKEDDIPF